jgi:hypothetical protein
VNAGFTRETAMDAWALLNVVGLSSCLIAAIGVAFRSRG